MINTCDTLNWAMTQTLPGVYCPKEKEKTLSLEISPRDKKFSNKISVRWGNALDDDNDDDAHNNSLTSFSASICLVLFDTTTL